MLQLRVCFSTIANSEYLLAYSRQCHVRCMSESMSRRQKINSSSEMMFKLMSLESAESLVTSWWKSTIASFSLMLSVFWKKIKKIKNHCVLQEQTFCISLQDWHVAIFPFYFNVTFLYDAQERLFDALCTPIILAEILFCDRDSMSVVTVARGCVKAGISSNANCSDLGVLRYRMLLESSSLRFLRVYAFSFSSLSQCSCHSISFMEVVWSTSITSCFCRACP